MMSQAIPRYLLGQVLALTGLGGGNDRALANAEKILDGLHRAREQVEALEVRFAHIAPESARRAWGREGSNLRPTDYESAALTAELRPRAQSTRAAVPEAQGSSR